LLGHSEDQTDIHLPLLLWWAIESKAETDRDAVMKLFEDKDVWRLPLVEKHNLERIMRRYAVAGKQKDLLTCAQLLRLAPDKEQAQALLTGFEKAYTGRAIANLPRELVEALAARGGGSLALRLRLGDAKALDEALTAMVSDKAKESDRLQLIQVFGEVSQPRSVPGLLKVFGEAKQPVLQQAALTALQLYGDASIGTEVVARYSGLSPNVRAASLSLLASRSAWTKQLLQAVDAGKVARESIPPDALRKFLLHRDEKIQELVRKNFGDIKGATTAEMRKEIDRLVKIVRGGEGEPYEGKKLFDLTCAKCHQLYNKGGDFGPDLTSYKRDDVDNMMLHIVNPSAEIREGYENYMVVTTDGRSLNGFLLEKDEKIVVLRGAEGQTTVIRKDQIDEMNVMPHSLMPEGLLRDMSDQQVRNLFAYLRSGQPLNVKD
jgi:putative heme-binding domain-containing protein